MAFRRLAYHRSWFAIVVGLLGIAAITVQSVITAFHSDSLSRGDDAFLLVIGGVIAILIFVRGLTGSWSKRQLRVDVPAGKLQLPDGSVRMLDELGDLTMSKHAIPRPRHRQSPQLHEYRLRASEVGYYLFYSNYESETKIRHAAVDAAVLQSRVRRILERPAGHDGAFRGGPDPAEEINQVAGSAERARAALQVLQRDHDREIRDRAAKLAAQLQA